MKTIHFLAFAVSLTAFVSCSSDDDDTPPLMDVESQTITNLHAPQQGGQGQPVAGPFTKFDFEAGSITSSETEWDIAFRGTTIIVNGGASMGTNDEPARSGEAAVYLANGTLSTINEINMALFIQDSETAYAIPGGSGNGWYIYNPDNHLIAPIAGKILVFKTRDGKYAKIEILSYYKDAPTNPDAFTDEGRYFTFSYVYQPNEGVTTF